MSKVKVTNTSPKVIGLGSLQITQNQTVELPAGFGLEHPTVAYFIKRGWLTKVSAGGVHLPPNVKADAPPKAPAAPTGNDEDDEPDDTDEDDTDDEEPDDTDEDDTDDEETDGEDEPDGENEGYIPPSLSRRDIERMNLDGLRELATRQGIAFEPNATRAVLIGLITAENGGQE